MPQQMIEMSVKKETDNTIVFEAIGDQKYTAMCKSIYLQKDKLFRPGKDFPKTVQITVAFAD